VSDLELFKGLKKGDRKVILELYTRFLPKVKTWILTNSGTEDDAHDIFQETLETVLLKVETINSSFSGLVLSMSKNKWIDKLRRKNKGMEIISSMKLEIENHSNELTQAEIEYQKYLLMEKYFNQLSELCQKIIIQVRSGQKALEISQALSLNSVDTLYRRKAACIERWSKLVRADNSYKELYL